MTDTETIRQAVREVRHEGYKAAFAHSLVDAVVVALAVNLVAGPVLGVTVPGPWPDDAVLAVAGLAGLLAFATEFGLRARQYSVERFEAENPVVADALRTARDATAADTDSVMAQRLYADVTDRLGDTSTTGFVNARVLAASVLAVLVLSGATLGLASVGVDISLDGSGDDATNGPTTGTTSSPNSTDGGGGQPSRAQLQDGGQVLGDPKDVDSGTEDILANVSTSGGGESGEDTTQYENSGLSADDTSVSAQEAGFDDSETVEDADLVREYNVRLNEDDSDD